MASKKARPGVSAYQRLALYLHVVQAERRLLEAQHQQLQAQLIETARRLNTLTHPSRLPPELLAEILGNLNTFSDSSTHNSRRPNARDGIDLVRASHVCHIWRETALSFPRLWRAILLNGSEKMATFLQRAQDAPLDVYLDTFSSRFRESSVFGGSGRGTRPPCLDDLCQVIHRAHTLRITLCSGWDVGLQGAPVLDAVQLRTYIEDLQSVQIRGIRDRAVSFSLLSALYAPNLERVQVFLTNVVWQSLPSFSRLRSLTILSWKNLFPQPTLADTLKTLHGLPALENLDVPEFNCDDHLQLEGTPGVTLPNLNAIELRGSILSCGALLHHLHLPASVQIFVNADIQCGEDLTSDPAWQDAATNIVAKVAAGNKDSPRHIASLYLAFRHQREITRSFRPSPLHPFIRVWTHSPPDRELIFESWPRRQYGAELSVPHEWGLAHTLPWTHPAFETRFLRIDDLNIKGKDYPAYQQLRSMSSVEELEFDGGYLSCLNDLLEPSPATNSIPFPKLRFLCIHGCDRSIQLCCLRQDGLRPEDSRRPAKCHFCSFKPRFINILKERLRLGLPKITLRMQRYPNVVTVEEEAEIRDITLDAKGTGRWPKRR